MNGIDSESSVRDAQTSLRDPRKRDCAGKPETTLPHPGPAPCLCVSVAVFRGGKVLLATRTAPPYAGAFSLPGGHVEAGETLAEAALRELAEEVQVEARIVGFNRHVEAIARDASGKVSHHYVIASFVGEWIGGEGTPGPEAGQIAWVAPERLGGLDGTPELHAVVAAAAAILGASR
jgi:ADP-ribose pyrophosphatase YjhB (NUDIX family)